MAGGWDGFTAALAATLPNLPAGARVLVAERKPAEGARYAQFFQEEHRLTAEVVAAGFLPEEARLSVAGEAAVVAAGWQPPRPGSGVDNWWQRLAWPATSAEYRQLASAVTAALRDGYGIRGPAALGQRAWWGDAVPLDTSLPLPVLE